MCRSNGVDRNLFQEAYTAMTVRAESITIEEGRELGLETALQLSRAAAFGGNKSEFTVNPADPELEALIRDLFLLPTPDGRSGSRAAVLKPASAGDSDEPQTNSNPLQGPGDAPHGADGLAKCAPNGSPDGQINGRWRLD